MTDRVPNQNDRPTDRPGCGGCAGLGAHSPCCPTQPGWAWRRAADAADHAASGATPSQQNEAWAVAATCRRFAEQAAATAEVRHRRYTNFDIVYDARGDAYNVDVELCSACQKPWPCPTEQENNR